MDIEVLEYECTVRKKDAKKSWLANNCHFRICIHPEPTEIRTTNEPDLWRLKGLPADANVRGFSDGFPYLMLSEESIQDINEQIPGRQYTHRSFRPNLVIKDVEKAWAEAGYKIGMKVTIMHADGNMGEILITHYVPWP